MVPESLDQRVLQYIRRHRLMRAGDRVGAAVSGGADSVALLRVLLELRSELGVVLSVVHFNHKIRGGEADADEHFVRRLAEEHRLEAHVGSGDTPAHAREQKLSLELAARELRYRYFVSLMRDGTLNVVATAHMLDDQAETILLRVLRGTGTRGLAAILPRLQVSGEGGQPIGTIIRPLLAIRREGLETYLQILQQPWCEDASNLDVKHTRNRVRHLLLPLMEKEFNPAVRERLAELADIARVEQEYWQDETQRVLSSLVLADGGINTDALKILPLALQRRTLRQDAETSGIALDFESVDAIAEIVNGDSGGHVQLGGGWRACCRVLRRADGGRSGRSLLFEKAEEKPDIEYEYHLDIPGEVRIPELDGVIRAVVIDGAKATESTLSGSSVTYNSSQLLNRKVLASHVTVRNWRAGDRFWPAHTSAPRKVKELLQERHVTGAERALWPVLVARVEGNEQIVWMRGYPVPEQFQAPGGAEAVSIIEEPFSDK
jgi:tRNA(Ile)-lysidine synthase